MVTGGIIAGGSGGDVGHRGSVDPGWQTYGVTGGGGGGGGSKVVVGGVMFGGKVGVDFG